MLTKYFSRFIAIQKQPSLISTKKNATPNWHLFTLAHLKNKNESQKYPNLKMDWFRSKMIFNFSVQSRLKYSKGEQGSQGSQREEKSKQMFKVLDEIIKRARNRCRQLNEYNLLGFINQLRQVDSNIRQMEIQDLLILSRELLRQGNKIKQIIESEKQTKTEKDPHFIELTQLSLFLLMRIYISSVMLSRVCLSIHKMHRHNTNKIQSHSESIVNETYHEMLSGLTQFDAFKLKYNNSIVHQRIQYYIKQGLMQYSLCRKKNISKMEVKKFRIDPKSLDLQKINLDQKHFFNRIIHLYKAIDATNYQEINNIYLLNSLLIIMSNEKYKNLQNNSIKNSLCRIQELKPYASNKSFVEIEGQVRFMVGKLIQMNTKLLSNELPWYRKVIIMIFMVALGFLAIALIIAVKQIIKDYFKQIKDQTKDFLFSKSP